MCVARPWLPPPLDTLDTADTVDTGQGDDGHGWNVWGNVPRVVQLRVTSRVLAPLQGGPALSSSTAQPLASTQAQGRLLDNLIFV